MSAACLGMIATAALDEDGDLEVALMAPSPDGQLSPNEQAASDLLDEFSGGTEEMAATMIEKLSALVPMSCTDCGAPMETAELVAALRKAAVVS